MKKDFVKRLEKLEVMGEDNSIEVYYLIEHEGKDMYLHPKSGELLTPEQYQALTGRCITVTYE